ncbi:FHA domain-containing protein [Vibrio sp.]|nr:FHA domain-containing protein [Vibrio sp.]
MGISIHLISVPQNEVVTSRVFYLPQNGGEIGRSPQCDVVLPDQEKRISRVHAKIVLSDQGYLFQGMGVNPLMLNDKPLSNQRQYPISDGDIIKLEQYSLLVTTMAVTENVDSKKEDPDNDPFLSQFNIEVNNDDLDFLDSEDVTPSSKDEKSFSQNHILSDDPFSLDPFEDLESDEVKQHIEIHEIKPEPIKKQSAAHEFISASPIPNSIEASINKLVSITENSQQSYNTPMIPNAQLLDVLEETIEQFLSEMSPTYLESQFDEYIGSSLFTSKQRKYWRIYKKHFQNRYDNGEYRRQFKALFLENMQKNKEEW